MGTFGKRWFGEKRSTAKYIVKYTDSSGKQAKEFNTAESAIKFAQSVRVGNDVRNVHIVDG